MYKFQSGSTLWSFLDLKELLVWNRRHIWSLSDRNRTQTHNHFVRKQKLKHLSVRYKLSGCGFEFHCCQLNLAIFYLFGSVLELTVKLQPIVRRSVLIWVNCLEDMLINHSFVSVMFAALCVTWPFLIISSNFRICLFFVKWKDFYNTWAVESSRKDSSKFVLRHFLTSQKDTTKIWWTD